MEEPGNFWEHPATKVGKTGFLVVLRAVSLESGAHGRHIAVRDMA